MQEIIDLLLPIAIGVIMMGIGIGLSISDFKRVFIEPKAVLFGLFGQMVLMVLIGFAIAFVFPLDPVHKIGIILIAACPGGTSSNIVNYMLNGRVALAVSITAFNSFLVIFTIPIILQIAFSLFWTESREIELSTLNTLYEIVLTVLIPVLIGIGVKHYFPKFAVALKKPLRYILPAILFTVFLLIILNERGGGERSLMDYGGLLVPALLLNVLVMFVGYYSSGWVGINHRGRYTIAIEMGLQNSALAIFIANNILKIDGLSLMAVLYGGFSFFTTFIIGWMMKNYFNREEKEIVT